MEQNKAGPRPCIARQDGTPKKALFHRFTNVAEVVAPSIMTGGHPGGQLANTYALLEFEDGRLSMEPVNRIIMLDSAKYFAAHDWETLGAAAKATGMGEDRYIMPHRKRR